MLANFFGFQFLSTLQAMDLNFGCVLESPAVILKTRCKGHNPYQLNKNTWGLLLFISIFLPFQFLFIFIFLLLFKNSCLHSPQTTPHTSPTPTSHPRSYPPLVLSMGPLYMFLHNPSPSFLPLPSSHTLPSSYCQFVLYFNVSGYILLTCLFC